MAGLRVPDTPANRDLLDHLRTFARPYQPREDRPGMDLDGWELHTHPDLIERFAQIAGSDQAVVPVHGVVVVVHNGVIVAAALGTDTLLFRLPARPEGLRMEQPVGDLESAGWYAVSAWQRTREAADRLTELLAAARAAVPPPSRP